MTDERKGQIALALTRLELSQNGFAPNNSFRREVGQVAKKTGIPFGDMLEFYTDETALLMKKALGDPANPPTDAELEDDDHHGHGGRFGRRGGH